MSRSDLLGSKKHWIQGAIKHPGALRAKAKKSGGIGPDGKLKAGWLSGHDKGNSTTAKQSRLAETLKGMHK